VRRCTARAYGTARALHGTATVKLVAPRPRVVDTGHAGFGVGSSALTPALRAWVRTVAKRIKGYRTATLTGFTSYGGPRAYLPNLALGRARAQAVATALRAGGYRGTLVVRSEGQSHSAQSNATAAGRAANRRVELVAKR
jgi:outer membrane protein OmpA-like peptidoglycan-associated protein